MSCLHWSQNLYDDETSWTDEWMCFPSFFWTLWSNENMLHVQNCTSWSWSEGSFATDIRRVRAFFQEVTISGTLPFISISQLESRVAGSHSLGGTCRLNKPLSCSLRVVCHGPWILSAELLPTCSALRVSMFLASACQVRDFALLHSWEVCAGRALKGVSGTLGCAVCRPALGGLCLFLQIIANGTKEEGALDRALKSSVCSCASGGAGNISHSAFWAS